MKNKKVVLSIVIFIVIILVLVICEDRGLFPGSQIAGLSTRIFMSNKHKNVEYTIDEISFNKKTMNYEVNCSSESKKFKIVTKRMKIYEDGYFNNFLRDDELENKVEKNITDKLSPILIQKVDTFKKIDVRIVIPKGKYDITTDENNITEKASIYIDLQGVKINEQDYRKLTYLVKNTIISEGGIKPEFLQIFYYRNNELGDRTMQFESQFNSIVMDFSEEDTLNSKLIHKIVEFTPEQEKKIKMYYMFQNFYYATIILAIVGIGGFTIYKKHKKTLTKN